jgi:hypothetical protein
MTLSALPCGQMLIERGWPISANPLLQPDLRMGEGGKQKADVCYFTNS